MDKKIEVLETIALTILITSALLAIAHALAGINVWEKYPKPTNEYGVKVSSIVLGFDQLKVTTSPSQAPQSYKVQETKNPQAQR